MCKSTVLLACNAVLTVPWARLSLSCFLIQRALRDLLLVLAACSEQGAARPLFQTYGAEAVPGKPSERKALADPEELVPRARPKRPVAETAL